MTIKRVWLVGCLLLLLAISVQPVWAQTYRFQVESAEVNLIINKDGTATIEYTYNFLNDRSASPIDFVDIGLPNESYNLKNASGSVNGVNVKVTKSDYVKPGITLELGGNAIKPGARGQVKAVIKNITGMLFKASAQESEPYASFQFSPNWYESKYAYGRSNMTVTLFLPVDLKTEEPRYFTPKAWPSTAQPETGYDQERVYYRFKSDQANSYTQYIFGGSFPSRLVPPSTVSNPPLFNIKINWDDILPILFCGGFFGWTALAIILSVWNDSRRRLQYLPPKISVEGHGIKRGLTAVEAAILMQHPMDKVVTMILFSTLKKSAATVISRTPLKVEVTQPLPEGLQNYEVTFLQAMAEDRASVKKKLIQDVLINLIKSVTEKMRGFSRKETIAYYDEIMRKAWSQVENANTPEVKSQLFDENLDWTLLDRKFEDRTTSIFGSGPVYTPTWWFRYDPIFRSSHPTASQMGPVSSGTTNIPVSLPNLPGSDFAASMVNGVQSFASNVVGDVSSFTDGITKQTNPAPVSSSSSSGRSGGGCACACACAGCACACAGGGR